MTAVRKELRRRRGRLGLVAMLLTLMGVLVFAFAASSTIGTSPFEAVDGNIISNGNPDWGSVNEARKDDQPTGSTDDSFGQGTKEDTPVPTVIDGSIPNNKSDLKQFGVYNQPGGFMELFWTRVQEPTGSTNMDFEFNQSSTLSANGVTPVRTAGDVLIQYDLASGGTHPELFASRWVTSGAGSQCQASNAVPCWNTRIDLTAAGVATGSINTVPITAGNSDGLGALGARTFGEAEVDLSVLGGGPGHCISFGSAYLKSRSSDSFSAALKDFIAPQTINVGQCGKVIIRKVTNPVTNPANVQFGYTKSITTDPVTTNTFSLGHGQNKTYNNVLPGNGYTVVEDTLPSGWTLDTIDCSASSGVTPSISGAQITFDINDPNDVVDCTYTNKSLGTIIVKKITDDGQGAFDYTTTTLPGGGFTLTTTGSGEAGSHSKTFANIPTGTYDVAETVPAGWNLASSACSDGSPISAIGLDVNETVTCTFHNARERGTIIVEKITDDGDGTFGYTSNTLSPASFNLTTTGPGAAGKNSRTFSSILVGTYDVDETIPAGWNLVSSTCSDGSPVSAITLSDGETVTCTFHNARKKGGIDILKLRKHAADGPGDHPHPGVTFTIEGGELPIGGVTVVTDANGEACVDGLVLSSFVGNYTVTETLPGGYHNVGPLSQTKSVTAEATCSTGSRPLAEFHNMPLTNIVVTVHSQVDGGTASEIDCDTPAPGGTHSETDVHGDGGQTHNNLEPGTYTCTVVVDP
jgi:Prealbumin-like fold domain